MIEPLYPLLDKQYVLFIEHLDALLNDALKVNVDRDNMSYFYCYSENMEDIYTVKFHLTFNGIGIHLIVYWNGKRMFYQSVSPLRIVDYEPKKSLKDECLKLVDDADKRIDQMLVVSGGNDMLRGIKLCLENLSTTINKIKDNT